MRKMIVLETAGLEALDNVLEYLKDELEDWKEKGRPSDHIGESVARLRDLSAHKAEPRLPRKAT